ncbi:MAG TPA: hypothetical protein VH417_01520 [Vicinamibacterales bacterium]|jgi:hypothetical protein
MDDKREFLRHTLATIAYRGGKALRGAPDSFAAFRAAPTSRTPAQIVAHLGDLFEWALSIAQGAERWNNSEPLVWDREVARFFDALQRLDAHLASDALLAAPPEKIFQGAIADALTHVGQLTMLRRLAGAPIRGENYYRSDIVAGRVGPAQTAPRREFD